MATASPSNSRTSSLPRWRQFSLRSLMALTLLCCVGLALWTIYVEPYRRQHRLAARIVEQKGEVTTENVDTFLSTLFGQNFFVNIVRIGAGEMRVDDEWMLHLRDTPGLRHLDVSRANISDAGLAHVAQLSHLQGLDIGGTTITDAGLSHVQGLHTLEYLYLRRTQVSDAGLASLVDLHRLRLLELAGCPISDAGLVHLAGLTDLRTLDLRDTPVGDEGIARLANLRKLTTLRLDNTDVTEASLATLKQLPVLENVSTAGTQILPSALREFSFPVMDRRIQKALSEPTVIEFVQTPLQDVVDYLKDFHRIEIQLDQRNLKEAGIGVDTPITRKVRGPPLSEAFDTILNPLGMKHVLRQGVLMITNKDDVGGRRPRLVLKTGEKLSRKLSNALYAPLPVEFVEEPLAGVLDYFTDSGIATRFADDADASGLGELPVTRILHIPAADALELLFHELDLHGVIENNTIHVYRGPAPMSQLRGDGP